MVRDKRVAGYSREENQQMVEWKGMVAEQKNRRQGSRGENIRKSGGSVAEYVAGVSKQCAEWLNGTVEEEYNVAG